LRLGIIGCGGISERHARGAALSDEVEIAACCGTRGHALLDVAWRIEGPSEVQLARSSGWGRFQTTRLPVAEADPYRLQLEHFARVARGEAEAVPALFESVVTAYTLDALLESAAERAVVPVEVPEAVAA
jgi:predicted dehydrogenase